jgi:hypothetical protein
VTPILSPGMGVKPAPAVAVKDNKAPKRAFKAQKAAISLVRRWQSKKLNSAKISLTVLSLIRHQLQYRSSLAYSTLLLPSSYVSESAIKDAQGCHTTWNTSTSQDDLTR